MSFKERLEVELKDLSVKCDGLSSFLSNDKQKVVAMVGEVQFDLLERQFISMNEYANILTARLADLELNENNKG